MKKIAQSQPSSPEVKNKEEVRIYRLDLLEENQIRILAKIEELERKLDDKYNKVLNEQDKRITLLETRNNRVNKFIWLVVAETLVLVGVFIQNFLLR